MDARIVFKVLLLVYKMLYGMIPLDLGLRYKVFNGSPDKVLLLQTPNFKTAHGKRIFAYHDSRLWNALPANVRSEENVDKFKKSVKTILFEGCEVLKKTAFK